MTVYAESKTKQVIEFEAGGTFVAIHAAEDWLRKRGYSVSTMCGDSPIGFKHGEYRISKWRNLNDDQRHLLDGVITSPDFREGGCQIEFWTEPKMKEVG